jgi:hypothetical protein
MTLTFQLLQTLDFQFRNINFHQMTRQMFFNSIILLAIII